MLHRSWRHERIDDIIRNLGTFFLMMLDHGGQHFDQLRLDLAGQHSTRRILATDLIQTGIVLEKERQILVRDIHV